MNDDILHRTRMLLGDDAIKKLHNATVMVIGCGAVGSFAIEALARTGVGHIMVLDFDTIAPSNINRQIFATHSTIATPKADAAHARIRDINPEIIVTPINTFWDNNTNPSPHPDFVIDAIDSVDSKIAIYKWCNQNNIPFIASMGAARKTDPTKIQFSRIYKTNTCPLAARVRKMARENNIADFPVVFSTETADPTIAPNKTFGSIITVTGIFGLYMANTAIMHIITHN